MQESNTDIVEYAKCDLQTQNQILHIKLSVDTNYIHRNKTPDGYTGGIRVRFTSYG